MNDATSGEEPRTVRIRRLPDHRTLLRRRARYEVEAHDAGGDVRRFETQTPGTDLAALVGSAHPADVSICTEAADLAWDGGTAGRSTGRQAFTSGWLIARERTLS